MQYYSEKTKRLYGSIDELKKDECEFDKKQKEIERAKKERADAAKRVDDARHIAEQAQKAYEEELRNFLKKYGNYHSTVSEVSTRRPGDIIEALFNNLPILF